MRERYQPIIAKLQDRIDAVSYAFVTTGAESYKDEYNALVFEMMEIKQAIKDYEDNHIDERKTQ